MLSHSRSWMIPLGFALVFAIASTTSYQALQRIERDQLQSELSTILAADVTAVRVWLSEQRAVVSVHARSPAIREAALALSDTSRSQVDSREALLTSPARATIEALLRDVVALHGYTGFGIGDMTGGYLASSNEHMIGRAGPLEAALRQRVVETGALITPPLWLDPANPETADARGRQVLLVLAPILDEAGRAIAILGLGLDATRTFSEILQVARMGDSGETYAFDARGLILSSSRFEPQLRAIGLLPEDEQMGSSMNLQVRDPGGDLTQGFEPSLPLLARPLTRMAASAVSRESGYDIDGYRDYRGVRVVGAWKWVQELEMGIATEIDHAEAYAGLDQLRLRMSILVGLLLAGTIGLFFYTVVLERMRSQVDRAQKLGRYELVRKVGEGGMGTVYLARHAMLRRPTAIKLLRAESGSEESLIRFEREVQVTSGLTHPNTISIYDYGRTPEGVFYYAMEYLEGLTVGQLVEEDGAQPAERVVHIMKQVCASLAEAHASGLIHRDLKPANVMLCEQGRVQDFVKVLDFGLVRTLSNEESVAVTQLDSLTGTPLYVSPEAVENPESLDQRADLYQLGAIAYYLLTGSHVFKGQNVVEVVGQHLHTKPTPPSEVLGRPVPPELEALILRCLSKRREDRPDDAFALGQAFSECGVEAWTQTDAEAWWAKYRASHPDGAPGGGDTGTGTLPSGIGVDFAKRRLGKTS